MVNCVKNVCLNTKLPCTVLESPDNSGTFLRIFIYFICCIINYNTTLPNNPAFFSVYLWFFADRKRVPRLRWGGHGGPVLRSGAPTNPREDGADRLGGGQDRHRSARLAGRHHGQLPRMLFTYSIFFYIWKIGKKAIFCIPKIHIKAIFQKFGKSIVYIPKIGKKALFLYPKNC